MSSNRRSSAGASCDDPPNSRLFIINSKSLTENDFRESFEKFGTIEELWLLKDKQTGENKGVTYIKFSKTSEAAVALEEMNGKCVGGCPRAVKIMIASSRERGSQRDQNEEERTQRLFVMVPKTMTDAELYDHFKDFGDIEYASVIFDKNTGESKGVAYVKYYKFSHAARAFEECDRKFRAVFAEPRKPNIKHEDRYMPNESNNSLHHRGGGGGGERGGSMSGSSGGHGLLPLVDLPSDDGYYGLTVLTSPVVNQDQLWRLFDIVPGMDYCHLKIDNRSGRGLATVVYTESHWAAHAKEKLHGFEYPPGYRLIVKPDYSAAPPPMQHKRNIPEKRKADLLQLAETIAQASSLIQAAGLSPDLLNKGGRPGREETICSVRLPEPMPMSHPDDDVAARCFIVCSPNPPPPAILKDVFCRFGNLIDVYMLHNRNCGYAKYSSREAAECAMKTLHGAEVNGVRLKVIEAEERADSRKRPKLDEDVY